MLAASAVEAVNPDLTAHEVATAIAIDELQAKVDAPTPIASPARPVQPFPTLFVLFDGSHQRSGEQAVSQAAPATPASPAPTVSPPRPAASTSSSASLRDSKGNITNSREPESRTEKFTSFCKSIVSSDYEKWGQGKAVGVAGKMGWAANQVFWGTLPLACRHVLSSLIHDFRWC
jgi:hypothetical protein